MLVLIALVKALAVLVIVLNISAFLLWIERKGSALIHDRIGANRASLVGVLPFNLGFVNTLIADPVKMMTKEDFVPEGGDRLLHWLAPAIGVFPILVAFAVVPFGDVLRIGDLEISLQVAELDVGLLYILSMVSLGVYGVVLAGWASNNPWALLGAIRGSAQMISYELGLGLGLVAVVMTYGTVDLQEMVRAQSGTLAAVIPSVPGASLVPAWGIFYQPVAFLVIFVAGIAESKRTPFDLPEGESELVAGFFTEYSGMKQATIMLTDFAEIVLVSALVTTFFFGGWQVPFLGREGLLLPGGLEIALPHVLVVATQFAAFLGKVVFFCWLQILVRWTVPRFRYDQLMNLGWKGLLPLSLANVFVTGAWILFV